jgi:spermidine dehydrogenase
MATGGWVNRYVIADLPDRHRAAYATFVHAPFLVANVAVRQWRFLDRLGITACRYQGDFGYSCNLRQPMQVGDYRPPLDPNKPALLTFYVPFFYPGKPPKTQGMMGRAELLSTTFREYERRIRAQMLSLFGRAGFDPVKDIAGLVLNRWGHAYVAPGPGFYFGVDGAPAARDVVRQPHGRIGFGHSELRGNQHWGPAAAEGARAMREVLARL